MLKKSLANGFAKHTNNRKSTFGEKLYAV